MFARLSDACRLALEPTVDILARVQLFDGVSRLALERLAGTLQVLKVSRGDIIIQQGDAPDDLYVVRSGDLTVAKNGEPVATLGADDWFGEIGLLRQVPRTATVRAAGNAELWRIRGADFLSAVNESALPATALLEGISTRLDELDRVENPTIDLSEPEIDVEAIRPGVGQDTQRRSE